MSDMKRREFITLLGGVAVAWPLAARAQQQGKVWRIDRDDQTEDGICFEPSIEFALIFRR